MTGLRRFRDRNPTAKRQKLLYLSPIAQDGQAARPISPLSAPLRRLREGLDAGGSGLQDGLGSSGIMSCRVHDRHRPTWADETTRIGNQGAHWDSLHATQRPRELGACHHLIVGNAGSANRVSAIQLRTICFWRRLSAARACALPYGTRLREKRQTQTSTTEHHYQPSHSKLHI